MPRNTPLIKDCASRYLRLREAEVSRDTFLNDRAQIMRFVRALGHLQVGSLTAAHLEDFLMGPDAPRWTMAPSSYNKLRSRLSGFLKFCQRNGWLSVDPMAHLKARKVPARERFRLSPSELLALPDFADHPRDRALLILAMNTALRASEIRRIRLRDVDLSEGSLHVVITKSALEDSMPITTELDEALRPWLRWYAQHAGALRPDAYLFPAKAPGCWRHDPDLIRPGAVWTMGAGRVYEHGPLKPQVALSKPAVIVQRALRAAGHEISAGEGLHTIRRSLARAYFERESANGNDVALRATAALLHHKSTVMTEHYLGLDFEKVRRDRSLRGQPFLSAMVTNDNVIALRPSSAVNDS